MILKLLRTDLRSEGSVILLAAAVSIVLWLSETALRSEPQPSSFGTFIYAMTPFAVLVMLLVSRMLAQKRRRLLAQLPVTGTAIRIASWLGLLSVIAIVGLIGTLMLIWIPPDPQPDRDSLALFGALAVAGTICLAAVLRIFWLSLQMRPRYRFVLAGVALLVLFPGNSQMGRWFRGEGPFRIDTTVQWDLLLPAAFGAALALVVADILLDRLTENHL